MKNIILTGTSSGFGLVTAKKLASEGHHVFATMRNVTTKNASIAAGLDAWAKNNNALVTIIELDVTDSASVNIAMEQIGRITGKKVDVLINNAGAAYIGLNETISAEQTNQIFHINVIGVDRMIKAVLPLMHLNKSGLIINISSVAARYSIPAMGTYAASKAAIDALSLSYYYSLKPSGIHIRIVQPGAYPTTDIVNKQMTAANPKAANSYDHGILQHVKGVLQYFEPTAESPNPEEVADAIVNIVAADHHLDNLWTIVGAGPVGNAIHHMNQATMDLTDLALNRKPLPVMELK